MKYLLLALLAMLVALPLTEAGRSPATCVCHLPKEPGLCKAYFPRYYFDQADQACKQFIYGGCGGNGNNFFTQKECEKTCL